MFGGIKTSTRFLPVLALAPVTPSTAAPKWITLKDARSLQVVVLVHNGTTVTGSAIGLQQATAVAGTSAKTLAFTAMLANADVAANGQASFTNTAVVSNTFTTTTTNSKDAIYVIDVDPQSLDLANNFDCFKVTVGDGANTTVSAMYLVEPKYGNRAADMPVVTTD